MFICFSWVCGGRHFLCTKYASYLECPCKSSLCILTAFLFGLYEKNYSKGLQSFMAPFIFSPEETSNEIIKYNAIMFAFMMLHNCNSMTLF